MTDRPASPGRPSRKIGMSPGSLVYIGRTLVSDARVDLYHFGPGIEPDHRTGVSVYEIGECLTRGGIAWIEVNGIHDVALVGALGELLGLHPLLLEDVVNTHQRAKLDVYGEHLFLVLRMLLLGGAAGAAGAEQEVEAEQVSFVIGPNYVVTFQERERDTFESVRRRLADTGSAVFTHGSDFLAYALVDTIVDNYFAVLEQLGDRIEDLEDRVIDSPTKQLLGQIFEVKSALAELRRSIWPLRDALAAMGRGDSPRIAQSTLPYLRDVQDHTSRVLDTIETYRDTSATLIDMYMSSVSNRLNDVMRVLTVIATVFIPLTFIVGIYGMNFAFMPELHWRWGYPLVWVVMGGTVAVLVAFFRRRGWL